VNPHIEAILAFCETASLVSLNEEKLLEVTQRFAQEDLAAPDWRAPVFLPEDSAEFIDFLGVGNSINFCFRDLETKQRFRMQWEGQYWEGAFGMWASLRRALEQGLPVLDAEFLSRMDLATARHIFRTAHLPGRSAASNDGRTGFLSSAHRCRTFAQIRKLFRTFRRIRISNVRQRMRRR